jgi:hypothetical protein
MATVYSTNPPTRHVIGDLVIEFFNTVAQNGDALYVGELLKTALYVGVTVTDTTQLTTISAVYLPSNPLIALNFGVAGVHGVAVMVISRKG